MIISIGSMGFDISIAIARFLGELLTACNGRIEVSAAIPYFEDESYHTRQVASIYYDTSDDSIKLSFSSGEDALDLCMIDIGSQMLVAQESYQNYRAALIHRNLANNSMSTQ